MKIGVLGSGDVAQVLASGFLKHGHAVKVGSRTPEKLAEWLKGHPKGSTGTFAEAAAFGEAVVLAVKGTGAEKALELAGGKNLAGKTVIDATNPIADTPPVNGVLQFFTDIAKCSGCSHGSQYRQLLLYVWSLLSKSLLPIWCGRHQLRHAPLGRVYGAGQSAGRGRRQFNSRLH